MVIEDDNISAYIGSLLKQGNHFVCFSKSADRESETIFFLDVVRVLVVKLIIPVYNVHCAICLV